MSFVAFGSPRMGKKELEEKSKVLLDLQCCDLCGTCLNAGSQNITVSGAILEHEFATSIAKM